MSRVAQLPTPADKVLTARHGLDFDHDGRRELIVGPRSAFEIDLFYFYECVGDNTFVLAHTLNPDAHGNESHYPTDAGDMDGDGRAELVEIGKRPIEQGMAKLGVAIYESASSDTYPVELTWEDYPPPMGDWWFGGRIADGDGDGKQEVVVMQSAFYPHFVAYENDGDNSYSQVCSEDAGFDLGQSFGLLSDIDGDGRTEAVYGELDRLFAFESTGDDTYEVIWDWNFVPGINVQFIVDGGDLDGDGKKEFLAGGLKSAGTSLLHIFEPVGDNAVEIVATLSKTNNGNYSTASVADVNGDGKDEIVFGTHNSVAIYRNIGDNAWEMIWNGAASAVSALGAGDHDGDGKDEIIFHEGPAVNGFTGIWEIDPAYAADKDHDGRVDVVDNCATSYNPGQEDADFDKVGDVCDNCVYGPNPAQGPAIFGQTIVAADATSFAWPNPADAVYVRGGLDLANGYGIDFVETTPLATGFTDESVPLTGAGFYYLVKPDCVVGSWQSELGAEPGRDAALP